MKLLTREQTAHIFRYMTKYRIDAHVDRLFKTARLMKEYGLNAWNEYCFRHMPLSRPDGDSVFNLEMDNSRDSSSCTEDRRNGNKGLCQAPRGSMVPGIYFDRDDTEQWTACSGLCDQADNVGMRGKVYTWQ